MCRCTIDKFNEAQKAGSLGLSTSLAQCPVFSGQWPPLAAPSGVEARCVSGHAQHDTGARRAGHGFPQRRRALEERV